MTWLIVIRTGVFVALIFELWVEKTNEAAIKFYEKLEFRIEGVWRKWLRMVKCVASYGKLSN